MNRSLHHRAGFFLTVVLAGLFGGAPLLASDHCREQQLCTQETLSGAMLTLTADESAITTNSTVTVTATLTAMVALQQISITSAAEGIADIPTPAATTVDFLAAGQSATLAIPVHFGAAGDGAVIAFATATRVSSLERYQARSTFNVLLRADRAFASMEDILDLKLRAVEYDFRHQTITEAQARMQVRLLTQISGLRSQTPTDPNFQVPTEWRRLPAVPLPAPVIPFGGSGWIDDRNENAFGSAGSDRTSHDADGGVAGSVNLRVHGLVQWQDENGTLHPLYGMLVQVRDDDTIGSELIWEGITGFDGTYDTGNVSYNDGLGAGDPDVFVRYRTENGAVDVEDGCFLCGTYETDTGIYDEFPGGEIVENFTCANNGTGPACSVLEGVTWAANFAAELNGNSFLGSVRVDWPGDPASSNYNCTPQCRINVQPGDRWDWDTLHHEYGHKVQDDFDIANNPGGPHNIGACIGVVHNSKDEGVRMAWAEGWPTYFGTTGQLKRGLSVLNVPRVGDTVYSDTEEQNLTYSIEANSNDLMGAADNSGLGEENEVAVTRVLFDLWDGNNDSRDAWSVSDQALFNAIINDDPTTLSAAWALFRANAGLTPNNEAQLAFGAIATDHSIAPQPTAPANNMLFTGPGASFNWAPNGCGSSSDPNAFQLRFFNATTFASVLTINKGGATSHNLTQADFNALVGAGHIYRWAVEGANTNSPATGPYLGDNRLVRVNRPPVCDAGGPYVVECQGEFTTVHLDGSGSSDPDGDVFNKTWSSTCPGVSFTNQNALVTDMTVHTTSCPTNCSVRLVLNDGFSEVECSANVTIRDTTNPVASNLTATSGSVDGSCSYSMPFTATVDDSCCLPTELGGYSVEAAVLSNNANIGGLGITSVNRSTQGHAVVSGSVLVNQLSGCPATVRITFVARDCCGNSSTPISTQATVTDNTPPVVAVCNAIGGAVDANCIYDIPFSATFTDNCHIDATAAQTAVAVQLLTANATLGAPQINRVQTNGSTVNVTGTVRVSNLTSCPVRVRFTFTPTDRCGNVGQPCVREVEVIDDTPPVPVCPPPITVEHGNFICDNVVREWLNSTTATDNCDTDVTIVNDAPSCGFPYGSTTVVTWTATDNCGNSAQCQSTITVRPAKRTEVSQKGSLLIYPKVELRWNAAGQLIQDTFITLVNDNVAPVNVHLFYIQGDGPLAAAGGERAHPGWNKANNTITLTQNEPTYWSLATGQPKGVTPFSALDGGTPPGRPDPEHPGERVLRGFILAFAVNAQDHEIRWNHLSGEAMILDYRDSAAWEYGAYAYGHRCGPEGSELLDCTLFDENGTCCTASPIPGQIAMDGFQLDFSPGQLITDVFAYGSAALSGGGRTLYVDTDLTLMSPTLDLRQETVGPTRTKAVIDIWNQNEVRFSNQERCLICWDEVLFSRLGAPEHLSLLGLQTNKGKVRINGVGSILCTNSVDSALLGVAVRRISDTAPTPANSPRATEQAGGPFVGADLERSLIQFDPTRPGGEATTPIGGPEGAKKANSSDPEILNQDGVVSRK